jgi:hypothetical protein
MEKLVQNFVEHLKKKQIKDYDGIELWEAIEECAVIHKYTDDPESKKVLKMAYNKMAEYANFVAGNRIYKEHLS